MSKDEKKAAPSEPMPQTGCVVCGICAGKFVEVTTHARAHAECAAGRPDVIAKVKARA